MNPDRTMDTTNYDPAETPDVRSGAAASYTGQPQPPEFWEVTLPPEQNGQRRVVRARFWARADADAVAEYLNSIKHPAAQAWISVHVTMGMDASAEAFIARADGIARDEALRKLSDRDKQILGLAV